MPVRRSSVADGSGGWRIPPRHTSPGVGARGRRHCRCVQCSAPAPRGDVGTWWCRGCVGSRRTSACRGRDACRRRRGAGSRRVDRVRGSGRGRGAVAPAVDTHGRLPPHGDQRSPFAALRAPGVRGRGIAPRARDPRHLQHRFVLSDRLLGYAIPQPASVASSARIGRVPERGEGPVGPMHPGTSRARMPVLGDSSPGLRTGRRPALRRRRWCDTVGVYASPMPPARTRLFTRGRFLTWLEGCKVVHPA